MENINLDYEKSLLLQSFANCQSIVHTDDFCKSFADEKIKHSLQVLGTGNYILKHTPDFQNRDKSFIKLAKQVCLLHDIGRFTEIIKLYENPNSKHDHSLYSYEALKNLGFTDLRLLLPIKQHGHLRNALFEDGEFKQITDEQLKTEIQELYQLVKDADKIANFYIIKTDNRVFHDLFASKYTFQEQTYHISDAVWNAFKNYDLVASKDVQTFSDRLLQIVCQVFELYYQPSFYFIRFHDLIENVFQVMRKYNANPSQQQEIENTVNQYIQEAINKS